MSISKEKRVALYLRVSTSGQTVENQRLDLERVAEQRGWQIVGTYIDQGISLWFIVHLVAALMMWGGSGSYHSRRWRRSDY